MEAVSVAIGSASFLYQVIKDLFEGGDNRRIKAFSTAQIDLTITEVDRKLNAAKQAIRRNAKQKQGTLKVKFAAQNCRIDSGSPAAEIRQMDVDANIEIDNLEGEANFVKQMLVYEKAKLI